MTESLLKKAWKYPALRKQIPLMINNQQKKYFALLDAAAEAGNKWREMQREYNQLQLDEAKFSLANPEQENERFNR